MRARWILAALASAAWLALPACSGAGTSSGAGGAGGGGSTGSTGGEAGSGGDATTGTTATTTTTASSSASSSGTGGGPDLCGNGALDPGEGCDGTDFGGKTCVDFGLGGGALQCNATCGLVVTGCAAKESCVNGKDDDLDTLADCDDPDCALAATCANSCTPPKALTLPAFDVGDTTGRAAVHKASCAPKSGREVVYQFTAAAAGKLAIQLQAFGTADFSLSVRAACADDASEIACSEKPPSGGPDHEVILLDAAMGATYFVMVDGVSSSNEGPFQLLIDAPQPELICGDFSDDDSDGYLDCDDTDCKGGDPACAPGAGVVGSPCLQATDCAANQGDPVCLLEEKGYPLGYCSEFCDLLAQDCAGNAVCAQLGLSIDGVCLDGCAADGDCRPGYVCADKGLAKKVCAPAPESVCTDHLDNDVNGLADCEDPSCQALAACVPGAKPAGQPCVAAVECFANQGDPLCIDAANLGWPGGYCSEYCDTLADDCAAGGECVNYLGLPSGHGQCLETCSVAGDCRPGYACADVGLAMKACTF